MAGRARLRIPRSSRATARGPHSSFNLPDAGSRLFQVTVADRGLKKAIIEHVSGFHSTNTISQSGIFLRRVSVDIRRREWTQANRAHATSQLPKALTHATKKPLCFCMGCTNNTQLRSNFLCFQRHFRLGPFRVPVVAHGSRSGGSSPSTSIRAESSDRSDRSAQNFLWNDRRREVHFGDGTGARDILLPGSVLLRRRISRAPLCCVFKSHRHNAFRIPQGGAEKCRNPYFPGARNAISVLR
jgi:hypothetical protein